MRPGTATITTTAAAAQQLSVTVTNDPVCLKQLHVLATTGAALTAPAAAALAASPAKPAAKASLAWEARQDLVWEDSAAMVLSLAQFTDGSVMDVSNRAAVTAAVPAGVAGVLPFNLVTDNSTQLQTVNVAVKVGSGLTSGRHQLPLSDLSTCHQPGKGLFWLTCLSAGFMGLIAGRHQQQLPAVPAGLMVSLFTAPWQWHRPCSRTAAKPHQHCEHDSSPSQHC